MGVAQQICQLFNLSRSLLWRSPFQFCSILAEHHFLRRYPVIQGGKALAMKLL